MDDTVMIVRLLFRQILRQANLMSIFQSHGLSETHFSFTPESVVSYTVTVHGLFEIPNSKHQTSNKSQTPNTNDQNMLIFPDVNYNPISFSEVTRSSFKIIHLFVIWKIDYWYLFVI